MSSSKSNFIVVRHSERMDEAKPPTEWTRYLKRNEAHNNRGRYSFMNDTLITKNGELIAEEAGKTVKSLIANDSREVVVYSSRLIRCVQTAYKVAKELGLPIYVATGLSMTAVAVVKRKFNYASLKQLQSMCPGTDIVLCDDLPCTSERYVSSTSWDGAIRSIVSRTHCSNIIVAHRETIRNLSAQRMRLPYCCIGLFAFYHNENQAKGSSDRSGEIGTADCSTEEIEKSDCSILNAPRHLLTSYIDSDECQTSGDASTVLPVTPPSKKGKPKNSDETMAFNVGSYKLLDCEGTVVYDFSTPMVSNL